MKRCSLKCNEVRYNSFTFPKGGEGGPLAVDEDVKKAILSSIYKKD